MPSWQLDAINFTLAAFAGACGALVGNPFFALKTRAQAYSDASGLAVGTQRRPEPLHRALASLWREAGLRGYTRGLSAFAPRVVAYGAVQLSVYDSAKRHLLNRRPDLSGLALQAPAGFVAACLAVTVIQPFDFVAARLMSQPVDTATGRGTLYSGPLDCVVKCVRNEGGLTCLAKGGAANAARLGPYTVLVLCFNDQLRRLL